MSRAVALARLRRLLVLAGHALRHDPWFRYALLGIALSLFVLCSHPPAEPTSSTAITTTTTTSPAPPLLPQPATLGQSYASPATITTQSPVIAPGRPLPAQGSSLGAAVPDDGFRHPPPPSRPAMSPTPALPGLLLLALLSAPGPALAGPDTPAPAQPEPSQLDRIEHKLDTLLHRLDQLQQAAPPALPTSPAAAAPAPAPISPPGDSTPAADRPGALLVLHPAPETLQELTAPPTDIVGSFVYAGGSLQLDDLAGRGVRYRGLASLELQGWLRAEDTGRYQLGLDAAASADHGVAYLASCRLEAWLEDRDLGSQQTQAQAVGEARPARFTLVLGADLTPGLYKLRLRFACTRERQGQHLAVDILEKSPADLNLRSLTQADLLHKER